MKRIIIILMLLMVLVVALSGCIGTKDSTDSKEEEPGNQYQEDQGKEQADSGKIPQPPAFPGE